MGNMKEIGLLDCEDRPSIEENFKRVMENGTGGGGSDVLNENGKLKNEVLPEGYPYEEVDITEIVVPEQTVTVELDGNSSKFAASLNCDLAKHEVGKTYIVTFDGMDYECELRYYRYYDTYDVYYIGNGSFFMSDLDGESVPFLILGLMGETKIITRISGTHTVFVAEATKTIYPIAERFLPNKRLIIDITNLPTNITDWRKLFDEIMQIEYALGDIYFDVYGNGEELIKASYLVGTSPYAAYNYGATLMVYVLEVTKSDGGSFKTYTVGLTETT